MARYLFLYARCAPVLRVVSTVIDVAVRAIRQRAKIAIIGVKCMYNAPGSSDAHRRAPTS